MMDHMPIDIVLVRHGESEGNLAQERSTAGDETDWEQGFGDRHTSAYRLTDLGRLQAVMAGEFLKKEFGTFDRYYASEYARARETAALLGLGGQWLVDFFLREQDMGILANHSKTNRQAEFEAELRRRELDSFYWAPPGGESAANLCLRINRILSTLRLNNSGFKVILVAHQNIIMGFRVCIEKLSASEFNYIHENEKAYNCQIYHFTRRNPKTGEIHNSISFMRTFVPWDLSLVNSEWKNIRKAPYGDADLLQKVNEIPQLVNSRRNEWPTNLPLPDEVRLRFEAEEKLEKECSDVKEKVTKKVATTGKRKREKEDADSVKKGKGSDLQT